MDVEGSCMRKIMKSVKIREFTKHQTMETELTELSLTLLRYKKKALLYLVGFPSNGI